MEAESRRRARRGELQALILGTIKLTGLLSVALLAPNVIQGMHRLGLVPSTRQNDVVRRSCRRMLDRGFLVWEHGKLRLTMKGERELRLLQLREESHSRRRWDSKWRVLIFDIPERKRVLRNRVRETLRLIGFVRLQGSVWVYPHDCEDLVTLLKADFKIGNDLVYMIVDQIENDGRLRKAFNLPSE